MPAITGNKIKSKDKSINKATKGFEAAGGCITLRYTIKVTATPTDSPKE